MLSVIEREPKNYSLFEKGVEHALLQSETFIFFGIYSFTLLHRICFGRMFLEIEDQKLFSISLILSRRVSA